MDIKTTFEDLKTKGLKAKNPDQSVGMLLTLREAVEACRWKGFSEADIELLCREAQKP